MSYTQQKDLESTYMMTTYGRKPVEFVRGEGMHLYDSVGKEYLDFLSGVGSVCLGHANPVVAQAVAQQAHKLMHVGNYFYIEGRGELAKAISDLLNTGAASSTPVATGSALPCESVDIESPDPTNASSSALVGSTPWKTFFANSGAEANEGAIKLARKYGKLYLEGAGTILTAKRSFHGRTLMTTAATGQEAKQASFAPMPSGIAHFSPNDMDDLTATLLRCKLAAEQEGRPELAPVAVMFECIQGEGGVWPFDDTYIQAARALTAEQGLLLIIDEVQTGFYRTGLPFAFMHAGIRPDVVTLAKGIANGFPCGAFAATGKAADVLVPGEHGSTFGGSALAVAAATATLAELASADMGTHVEEVGAYFAAQLAKLPHVTEVRGKGLMLGIALDTKCAAQIGDEALQRGMVINVIGSDILRFLPPLIVSHDHIDTLIDVLAGILSDSAF